MSGVGHRILCALTALVLTAAGTSVLIDVIAVAAGHPTTVWPQQALATHLADSHWGDITVMAVAAAIAVLGLLLLRAAASRGRRRLVPLLSADEHTRTVATRRGLCRSVAEAVGQIDGVDAHHTRIGRRRVKVKATTPRRSIEQLHDLVRDAVHERLEALRTDREYRVTVKVRTTGRRP
ncbi:DUF6286 domain-containing protein [Streptomyces sp. RPT161]|uniref:DUF6286 domain-containing protein n=1 Tax=Streptomyces sp. RPT161 TaxID=3015993 RepID=UPI0022B8DB23|nr:DUF6286 domain-containing protein [Streptomyces sp. RPT161]